MLNTVQGVISVKSCYRARTSQWDGVTSHWHFLIWFPNLAHRQPQSPAVALALLIVHSAGRVPKMASVMWHVIMHLQHNFMVSIIFWAPQSPIDIETSLNQCIRYLLCYSEKKIDVFSSFVPIITWNHIHFWHKDYFTCREHKIGTTYSLENLESDIYEAFEDN